MQIITEAAYRPGNQVATICPGPDWKGLRGMGNIPRHAYHRLDNRVIWAVLTGDLPVLKQAATEALQRLALLADSKADLPTD